MRQILSGFADWLGWRQTPLTSATTAAAAALFLAIVFGWLEAVQHFIFSHEPSVLTIHKVSAGVFWTAPFLTALVTVAVAIGGAVPRWWLPGWPSVGIAVLASSWLGAYGAVTLTNKVHKGAAAIFALGVAVALWRAMRRPPVLRFVRQTTPALVCAVVLVGPALWMKQAVDGWRWTARLPAAAPGAPNVLIVVMDTVRADHLSLYGYGRQTTPNVDRWAADGVVFDSAWSTSSWTLPAHASLLTGRPADEHGADHGSRLDGRFLVLPELLTRHGYVTGAFIANNIWINPEYGFDRGFQTFHVHTPFSDASRTVWGRKVYGGLRDWLGITRLPDRRDAADVNRDLLRWLDGNRGRPFFALVNYFDVHDPYHPPPPFDSRFTGDISHLPGKKPRYRASINAYDGLLAYVDLQVGLLRRELEQRDLARNTIVVITSDHGEALGDQNQPQHGKTLHRAVLRVPLIVIGPGVEPRGARVRQAVSVEAIPATVTAFVLDGDGPFPGTSLLPARSTDGDGQTPVLAELKGVDGSIAAKSLITSGWQYIWNAADGSEELYDLDRDPLQLENLAASPGASQVRSGFRTHLRALFPDLAVPAQAASKPVASATVEPAATRQP